MQHETGTALFWRDKALHPSRWDVHLIVVKKCENTRQEQQLARATEQYIRLNHALPGQVAQQSHKVRLHTILIGVMGTIFNCQTELPLSMLGLGLCRVKEITLNFNTHSSQHAKKIINPSRRSKNNAERTYCFFLNPYDCLPYF